VKQKEEALNFVLKATSGCGYDSMDVQDVLLKHDWDRDAAVEDIKSRPPKQKRSYYSATATTNSHQNGNAAKKLKRDEEEDAGGSDVEEYDKHNVFDSDDSENEYYTEEMTTNRKEVYEFFNSANVGELTSIKSCSLKKAEIIIENRPYRNWEELVAKFQDKPLQTDLLNNAQEYLDKRNSLKKLMKKCKAIVLKLEKAVSEGAGITEQPFTLNEGLQLSNYQLVSLIR
jgi:SWI/SNF-related matrix-associated actin-dependent regulator of chromatin subfamily A containing DEAD/H box 1